MERPIIAPSLLSANFLELGKDIAMINASEAGWFHLDIMDGKFVPNITFGLPVIKQIKTIAEKPLDVHLMIEQPERYITDFQQAGADILTVHYEAVNHLHRIIYAIKEAGMKAGVALNPHTPVECLQDIIRDVDMVLIMSVNPGFGGQKFISQSLAKIARLKEMITHAQTQTLIEVDGGVDTSNATDLVLAGADILVSGSFVFKSKNPQETIKDLIT
ncbi:MAG: ribulose-phosphate 3-epimerase [Bacteroidales bacterium]|nr:ribulose-phosphate 3-epimerase [Bacteroidales bacterium]